MKIIGLTGKKEVGKSTFAKFIQDHCTKNMKCIILPFSSILKTMLLNAGICTEKELYFDKNLYSREMMQKIGTDIIRDQIDTNFFCKRMLDEIREIAKENPSFHEKLVIVIDDVRFQNEAKLIEDLGGILIRIVRPRSEENIDPHRSETEMDQIKTVMPIFNDSDLDNLERAGADLSKFIPAFKNTTIARIAMVDFD
jgi:hypothetical protein